MYTCLKTTKLAIKTINKNYLRLYNQKLGTNVLKFT